MFSISTNSDDTTLIFSFVGYKTKELKTSGLSGNISVTLEEDLQALEEVVLIGYGKQEKSQVTSAVASVSEKDFNPGKIQDAADQRSWPNQTW